MKLPAFLRLPNALTNKFQLKKSHSDRCPSPSPASAASPPPQLSRPSAPAPTSTRSKKPLPIAFKAFDDKEAFKKNEYLPLIEHHKDCVGEEETDETTDKVNETITKCCEACKCVFYKVGEDDEE